MKRNFFMVAAVAIILLATGCAKEPTPEIDLAKAAIQEALDEGANEYEAVQLAIVQDSMGMVMEQIAVQKSKFIPKYGDIKTKLAQITTMANAVKQSTGVRKEALREETQTVLAEVKTLTETNKSLVASAPKGKEGVAALEMINADIAAIETLAAEADAMLGKGELMGALDKSKVAKAKAENINTELKTVIEKSTKKTRK